MLILHSIPYCIVETAKANVDLSTSKEDEDITIHGHMMTGISAVELLVPTKISSLPRGALASRVFIFVFLITIR